MPRYEHRVFRVTVAWDGGDYYLAAMIQKSEWMNVDHLGEKGWEFVAFVPGGEYFFRDSFDREVIQGVRLAVFKRQMEDHEQMEFGSDRAN